MKWIVWEGAGEKIIHVSCYVDKEEMMLEVALQDLKGSLAKRCACHYGYATLDQGSARTIWAIGTLIKGCPVTHVRLKACLWRLG
jgi:hypothetical protein